MTISLKVLVFLYMSCWLQAFASELSVDLHKACTNAQLSQHKNIKGRSLQASDFNQYCSCETDFVMENATKEQLSQIPKKQSANENWLNQLKSKARKTCLEQKKQINT
jgi:hypothetical protein